jgi:hypothetical protein
VSGNADHVHAIQNLKARYCATADCSAHDPDGAREAFRSVFTDDVVADYGSGELAGEAVAEFMCTAVPGNSEWMLHMLHSPLVEIDGETATASWTVSVRSKRRPSGAIDDLVGRYDDRLRLTAGGWRIAQVRFTQLT